jgi:hypothetical protein
LTLENDSSEKTPLELKLDAAREKFPNKKLFAAETAAGPIVITTPAKSAYQMYRAMLLDESVDVRARAMDTLLINCAIDPNPKELKALIDNEWPGLSGAQSVMVAVQKAVGITVETTEKK